MVGRTLAKWKISLWFCWDYGWQNVGKVKKVSLWFCSNYFGRTLAKWEVSLRFCSDYDWQNVGKVRSFALILLGWTLAKWKKFRFDFTRILAQRWQSEKFRLDFVGIMVGRTLAKWEVSLWFCWDYGWQNVGKVRSFALILLGLWLAERWQSEKFRFDFAPSMVGRTLAKWEVSLWLCSEHGW